MKSSLDMATRRRQTDKNVIKEPTVAETFSKALKPVSKWEDKDEFLDVVYWMRQIVGVILGVTWGVIPIKGLIGILLFLAINSLVVYVYFSAFQKVDEEDYGGIAELLKEGLMTSFATFLVSWIILYSALHYD